MTNRLCQAEVMTSQVSYARALKRLLPSGAFAPARSRLLWLPAHLAVIILSMYAVVSGMAPWPLVPVCSLLIGLSFAGMTFLAHETLHGAVVRSRRLRHVIGWIGFSHFVVSPLLWNAWHNRVHHGHANHPERDPDAYPTLETYEADRWVRHALELAPGNGRWTGLVALVFGFSIHSAHMLVVARRRGYLTASEHRRALLETALAAAAWAALAVSVGLVSFVLVYVVPLLVANAIVMAFILTNHSLSPMVPHNDPMLSTLSVTLPPMLEWVTLRFGYHVEHHIYPSMSSRHAPAVRELLRQRWPGRYQSLPLGKALLLLHHTPRVYKDHYTVVDPGTRRECSTLAPRLVDSEV
jgi:fatty acid desaturase